MRWLDLRRVEASRPSDIDPSSPVWMRQASSPSNMLDGALKPRFKHQDIGKARWQSSFSTSRFSWEPLSGTIFVWVL